MSKILVAVSAAFASIVIAGCGQTSSSQGAATFVTVQAPTTEVHPSKTVATTTSAPTTTSAASTTSATTTGVPTTTTTSPCFTAEQAFAEIGQTGCVQYTVGSTHTSYSGQMYLDQYSDYTSGFSVWIPAGNSFGPGLLTTYANQTIRVSGVITSYQGAPEIIVNDPSQIQAA